MICQTKIDEYELIIKQKDEEIKFLNDKIKQQSEDFEYLTKMAFQRTQQLYTHCLALNVEVKQLCDRQGIFYKTTLIEEIEI
jgi:hypothetical protein